MRGAGVPTEHRGDHENNRRVVRNVPKWGSTHIHTFRVCDRDVVGHFKKGQRDTFATMGDYHECQHCKEGRFVPKDISLSVVPCRKEAPAIFED